MVIGHSLNDGIDLILRRKDGHTDVVGVFDLSETRAGNSHDAGVSQQLHAVECIGVHVGLLGGLDGLLGQSEAEVGVQGAIDGGTIDALHLVQRGLELDGSVLERGEDIGFLLDVEGVGGLAGLGRANHDVDGELTVQVGAEGDGHQLDQLSADVGVQTLELEVAAATAALAPEALGDGVEGDHLETLASLAHVVGDLSEGDEGVLLSVDVLLVDLIGEEDNVLVDAEVDELLHHLVAEALGMKPERGGYLAGGVAGVDDDDGLDADVLLLGLFERGAHGLHGHAPSVVLVQVVVDLGASVEGDGGGVERVLGDGEKHTVLLGVDEHQQAVLDTVGGAVGEEDVGGVAGVAVPLADKVGDVANDHIGALGLGVGAGAALGMERRRGRVRGWTG